MSTELRSPAAPGRTPVAKPGPGQGRAAMRRVMFLSWDGVVLCTTLRALDEIGILEPSLEGERSLGELAPDLSEPGFGAVRVGIRTLASVGWLAEAPSLEPETTILRWTDAGELAMRHRDRYVALGRFLAGFDSADDDAWSRPWEPAQAKAFTALVPAASARLDLDPDLPPDLAELIRTHLDAALIVPSMLSLAETSAVGEKGPALPAGDLGEGIGRLLASVGWLDSGGGWTETGRHARGFALSFGGVATYMPMLARLPELYRGELTVTPDSEAGSGEWHVHRRLNVAISTQAHQRYFADADRLFGELFDRPAGARPGFIADMGCGDGSWLLHLHELLSARGEAPRLVGIDVNPTALAQARRKFDAAGVDGLLLIGDITDPDRLAADLAEHGLRMEDGLHIRAFLDHDRSYRGADPDIPAPGWSTGAYIDREGRPLSATQVERDLIAHLRRWTGHVGRHGLVMLEAHCVSPELTSRHLGALHSVAFDAYQAYSQQYPVDHAAFMRCCREAGLRPDDRHERRYPSSRPFVTISLNRLVADRPETPLPAPAAGAPREDTWQPDPATDLEDGRALHEMLFAGGDIRHPRMWHGAATGFVVSGALAAIEARLASASAGDVIRVLDYGAGTGTATIELLKACRERGIEEELERRGAALEVHVVDLPTSWFAQGFALLSECDWTRFHSLRDPSGGFRPLLEVTGGLTMDAVMVNMVFHLIQPRALERAAAELAAVTAPGGSVLWSAPDLGPAGRYSLPMHDITRTLRARWLELLHGEGSAEGEEGSPDAGRRSLAPRARQAARELRERLDADALREAQERAERHFLAHPIPAADVAGTLERHFEGEIELRGYEMLAEDILNGALVPSNQGEFLPEIAERELREEVIRELMIGEVIPAMQAEAAGTAHGVNLHWTLGAFTKR